MPDRIVQRGRWVIITLFTILILTFVLGIATTFLTFNGANAVNALKTSSTRGECRTRIQNEDNDKHWGLLAQALDASIAGDNAKVNKLVRMMVAQRATQERINDECPAPLVQTSHTKGGGK